MKLFNIFILIALLGSCRYITNSEKQARISSIENSVIKQYWINNRYSTCLMDSLTDKCTKAFKYLLLEFDSSNNQLNVFNYEKERLTPIVKCIGSSYQCYDDFDSSVLFKFVITDNKLILTQDEIDSTFFEKVNLIDSDGLCDSKYPLLSLNLILVNNTLKLKFDFDMYSKLHLPDSAILSYNRYFGNVIMIPGTCKNKYLIEKNDSVYFIYKFENSCQDLSTDFKVKKTLLYQLSK